MVAPNYLYTRRMGEPFKLLQRIPNVENRTFPANLHAEKKGSLCSPVRTA
jgi:hypothetical protein